jgi:uncharacterized protein
MASRAGFEWDAEKARSNLRKHGIDFADAVAVLEDDQALTMPDRISAVDEQRFVAVGRDAQWRILVVVYTWRGGNIRLVSARRAMRGERGQYLARRRP